MPPLQQNECCGTQSTDTNWKTLYKIAGVAALVALSANLLDIILGFGETDIVVSGSKTALDWFALFQEDWFKGLYVLGILNIVYNACLVPIYFAMFAAHRRGNGVYAALAMVIAIIGMAVYISNNAAIPMFVLAGKYAAAGSDVQRALLAAAGEAVLAFGEDFTPGSFTGMILGGISAIAVSFVMLRGGIFGKVASWIGIVGFTFISVFTVLATFVPSLYFVAFYLFGMIGGLLVLSWFVLVSLKFFKLGRSEK
ncbi:hypothetical protein ACOBQJ_08925 [Pelotomaculum propionicicum]|uniref:hypothetical protein n=1 Tax=Pelotomaculum propionicicum TaxID=258475 RepID=UPI003B7E3E9B